MGRPSLAEQRKEEILKAFGTCVARYGLEGSTLEKIAEEAGMRRSIIRHYIGNRDELVVALANRVIGKYRSETKAYFDSFREKGRVSQIIKFLLPDQAMDTVEQILIIEGLIGASGEYPEVQKLVRDYIDDLVDLLSVQLKLVAPKASRKQCWEVAYALVCLSFNHESLQPLELPTKYLTAARKVARTLIDGLGGE